MVKYMFVDAFWCQKYKMPSCIMLNYSLFSGRGRWGNGIWPATFWHVMNILTVVDVYVAELESASEKICPIMYLSYSPHSPKYVNIYSACSLG